MLLAWHILSELKTRSSTQEFLRFAQNQQGGYVPVESNEPAYILATSGTTAKPKLAIPTHGGYQVHIHSMGQWVFGLKPTLLSI